MRDEAFERLYAEHARSLLGFLVYRTGDRQLSEDVLADTFERVLRAWRRFDRRRASEKTWIYTIALNCLRDHLRRQGAETRALERTGVGGVAAESGDWVAGVHDRDELRQALGTLRQEEREAVALRYGANLTIPELANLLGESQTTIKGRVFRGLAKLREGLQSAS